MPVERHCVVCGIGSHKVKWGNTLGDHVACDSHTPAEVKKAVDKISPPVSVAAAPVKVAPVATSKTPPTPPAPVSSSAVGHTDAVKK